MGKTAKRLRKRLREAVSATTEPQLQRAQDDDLREGAPTQAERDEAVKDGDAFSDGSYPIRTQKRANDAWDLRNSSKTHSEASVVAHIRKQVKKHGLTMPGTSTREALSLRVLLREAGVVKKGNAYEVTVVREGPGNPGDRNYYTKQALREAVNQGLFEGLQAYLNHPTPTEERERPERDVRYLAGHFREAKFVDGNPAEVRAKFIPGGMDKDGVVQLIESALESPSDRPLVGISIDGYGHAPDEQEVNGRTYNMVREVTHLGSADIVTRAGAGGRFRRRLQEAWQNTNPALEVGDLTGGHMKPAKLQEKIKAAVAALEKAAGLPDEQSEQADELVSGAITSLRECASVEIKKPKTEVEIREVEKPVAASDEDKDQLAAKLAVAERKLQETESTLGEQQQARKDAEGELKTLKRAQLAAKVIREAELPKEIAADWFEEIATQKDEDSMRKLVERKKSATDALLQQFRESVGVEGVPARVPALAGAPAGSDSFDRLGIDPADYGLEAA